MALKEGRCTNCGSILFLEPKNEKGHCLFCDAVFDNSEAFRANLAPDQFTFPNEPQPKYDGPNLDPRPSVAVAAPSHRPAVQKKTTPAFEPKVTSIPDAKIPPKAKILAVGIMLAVLLVMAAILVPLIVRRDAGRKAIREAMEPALSGVDWDKHVSLLNMKNDYMIVSLPEAVAESEAKQLFAKFREARTEKAGDGSAKVTLRLVSPQGGFVVANENGQEQVTAFE